MSAGLRNHETVDRCACLGVSFDELKRLAERRRCNLDGLIAETGCCTCCGRCEEYIARMLRTGKTRFAPDGATRRRANIAT